MESNASCPETGASSAVDAAPRLVHLLTRLTGSVFAFVGPVTAALATRGVAQTVVLFDDAAARHLATRFDPRVQLHWVADGGTGPSAVLRLRRALGEVAALPGGIGALHLHGVLAALSAAGHRREAPVYFSPHASRLLEPGAALLGRPMLALAQALLGHTTPIAALESEARGLPAGARRTLHRLDATALPGWLDAQRGEGLQPQVVASVDDADDPEAAARVARLAVLLSGGAQAPRFTWIGPVDADGAAQLKAAGVIRVADGDEAARRQALAEAWVHLSPARGRGLPGALVQALAAGIACIAIDTPEHRETLVHGRTGLLFDGDAEAPHLLAQLLDRSAWRLSLGAAARDEATRRFDPAAFAERLVEAYRVRTSENNDRRAAPAARVPVIQSGATR